MSEVKLEKKKQNSTLPIDKQKIKGKIKHVVVLIPALDERWIVERKFGFYIFPPRKLKDGNYQPGVKDLWIMSMSYVLDDIWWLCELQYHKFWSQIIYDKKTMNGIKSFLHLAPLQKLYYKNEDDEILSMYKRIEKAVFQFIKRFARSKESEVCFMSDEKYYEIMSKNEIISISLIFCICTIYGEKNRESVKIIVSNLFESNKNLKLDKAVLCTVQLFNILTKKIANGYKNLKKNLKYIDDGEDLLDATNSYRYCLFTALQFLTNAVVNVSNFLFIYEDGCEIFQCFDFELHIVRTYKKLLIPMYQKITILFSSLRNQETYHYLVKMIYMIRLELTKTFKICLQTTLSKISNDNMSQDALHHYIKVMKFALKTKELIEDLNKFYNLKEITEKIKMNDLSDIDMSEIDKISDSIIQILEACNNGQINENTFSSEKNEQINGFYIIKDEICHYMNELYNSEDNTYIDLNKLQQTNETWDDNLSSDYSDWSDNENSDYEYDDYHFEISGEQYEKSQINNNGIHEMQSDNNNGILNKFSKINLGVTDLTSDLMLSQIEFHSAVTHVKDLLPHLGDGFIALCLKHYKMDTSAVINNILEDNLPPFLKSIDFTLSSTQDDFQEVTGCIEDELCNQEQYNKKKDLRELKKFEYTSYNEMLNDKTEINNLRSIYEKYRNIEEDDIYNDDIDEGYDEHRIALPEIDSEGYYTNFTMNNANLIPEEENVLNTDSEKEEDLKTSNTDENTDCSKKILNFCENPEIIRARNEHQKMNFEEKRYRKNYRRARNTENNKEKLDDNTKMRRSIGEEKLLQSEKHYIENKFHKSAGNYYNPEKFCKQEKPYYKEKYCNQEQCFKYTGDENEKNRYREERKYSYGNKRYQKEGRYFEGEVSNEDDNYYKEEKRDNITSGTQDENIARERYYKTVYKSRNANHNRRFLSDRKRQF